MFEREVKFIYDFNSNKVKSIGNTATYTELLPLGIHPAILQYISAEIDYRIYEDRQTLLKHSMFDYSTKNISMYFKKINDEIKKEKRFSTDFLCKVILHATSFNVNYLIRPNWSLNKLIFDTNESNNVSEIHQILNYVYFYKYLIKVIRNYIEKKKLITLDKNEFSELLTRFDKISIESYGNDILESAIKSMSSFFNIGSVKQNTVPLQGIVVFLQEKNLNKQLESIQKNIKGEIKGKIEINDLRSILSNIPLEKTEVLDFPQESDADTVTLESDKEKEPKQEEEKTKTVVEEEIEKSGDQEKEFGNVEIKLRENKEKEIAEIQGKETDYEDTLKDKTNEARKENKTEHANKLEDESPEEVMEIEPGKAEEDEVSHEDEEINKTDEYLLDSTEENTEVILTHDDEIEENKKDTKEETLKEDDEIQITDQAYLSNEDDYSYPERGKSDELNEDVIDETSNNENHKNEIVEEEYTEEEAEELQKLKESEEESDEEVKEEKSADQKEEAQETLFGDIPDKELINDEEPTEEFLDKNSSRDHFKRIDIADLLENKNMTKIISVIFDYDMEEFANAIEKICESENIDEAIDTLQEIFELNQVNPSSKEAQAFKDIISEYFEQE